MDLCNPVGIWFSELGDNWESCDFFYWETYDRHRNGKYRHYGDLPDGRPYGVYYSPLHDPWPAATQIQIVEETGESRNYTYAEDVDWDLWHWPLTVAASPGGGSLVWLIEGQLWAWQVDPEEERFMDLDGHCLTERLKGRLVRDARMRSDGILELKDESGIFAAYLCDADVVLTAWENGWVPAGGEDWRLAEARLSFWPDSLFAMIRKEHTWGHYSGSRIRQVCFEAGLNIIEGDALADNPDLKSVVIPACVQKVDFGAFHGCTNLRELVIEGDLTRVADWDEGAFDECPCEKYYLHLRNTARQSSGTGQLMMKNGSSLQRMVKTGRETTCCRILKKKN